MKEKNSHVDIFVFFFSSSFAAFRASRGLTQTPMDQYNANLVTRDCTEVERINPPSVLFVPLDTSLEITLVHHPVRNARLDFLEAHQVSATAV